ncbi:hypothetical protein [Paenibacillus agricola]|uniref:Uncharacterized protein n=1 Tax=Paenibacillus agricola TaxID=2716264 RepID=A0ABX0JFX2_9BACL|nr:hypothetical protein [Paenibacillus agricola]NHN33598.1 hypothetical protein [Paenibacillus agricola]
MSKVFVEYQILPQHRPVYSGWIQNVKDKNPEMELLEGVDQPGLFIEVWNGMTREAFERMKTSRKSDIERPLVEPGPVAGYIDVDWRRLDSWIEGGAAKIHIWHFNKVR